MYCNAIPFIVVLCHESTDCQRRTTGQLDNMAVHNFIAVARTCFPDLCAHICCHNATQGVYLRTHNKAFKFKFNIKECIKHSTSVHSMQSTVYHNTDVIFKHTKHPFACP
jgi:hypothetical protein